MSPSPGIPSEYLQSNRSQVLKNLMNMVLAEGEETPSPFRPLSEKLEDAENSSLRLSSEELMPHQENQTGDHTIVTSIELFTDRPIFDLSIGAQFKDKLKLDMLSYEPEITSMTPMRLETTAS